MNNKKRVFFLDRCLKILYFCSIINQIKILKFMKTKVIIDSPYIADTPVIRGEEARRFLKRMLENRKETPEKMKRMLANYEMIMKNSKDFL